MVARWIWPRLKKFCILLTECMDVFVWTSDKELSSPYTAFIDLFLHRGCVCLLRGTSPTHAMRAYTDSCNTAAVFLISTLGGVMRSAYGPVVLFMEEKISRYQSNSRQIDNTLSVCTFRRRKKILPPPGFENRICQPVAQSLYRL